ncbi:MAG: WD40 repeat domain-containing serine/threonine-protein kinase [Planctomycetota bacterium]
MDLVFGILAMQFGFLSKDDLVAATSKWITNRSREFPELLESEFGLTREQRRLLEGLVQEHQRLHPDQSLAEKLTGTSIRELTVELEKLDDSEVDRTLAEISALNTAASDSDFSFGDDNWSAPIDASSRFQILRPHAKGGLGAVSVAQDTQLKREVAVKEILSNVAKKESSLARFQQEAEIAGALEHPNIVPVYGLGTFEDGRPFYAMRLIRGDSLKTAIAEYHAAPAGEPQQDHQVLLRRLMLRLVDICNAVDYAHSRGVLHRDLKPGNIMLGKYGETILVDWGLAKATGKQDAYANTDETTDTPVDVDAQLTGQGQIIGTPTFMSPEQASGKLDSLGPATDIYSLGGTLYCILTGKPPHDGDSVQDILSSVRSGDIQYSRQILRGIPPGLSSICKRAMALRPEDRYASAGDMAADIEAWLADGPVSAHAESFFEWTGRLFRRNRSLTLSVLSAATVITLISFVTAIWVNQARLSERRAKDAEQTQRLVAESNARRANSLRLASLARNESQRAPELGALLALESVDATRPDGIVLEPSRTAAYNLLQKLAGRRLGSVDYFPRQIVYDSVTKLFTTLTAGYDVEKWQVVNQQKQAVAALRFPGFRSPDEPQLATACALSPDGRYVVHSMLRGELDLYDWTGDSFDRRSLDSGPDYITQISWSSDSRYFVTLGNRKRIRLYSVDDGSAKPIVTIPGGYDQDSFFIAVSRSGRWILRVQSNDQARLYSRQGDIVSEIETDLRSGAVFGFSPDGNSLFVSDRRDGFGKHIHLKSSPPSITELALTNQDAVACSVAFSNDGEQCLIGFEDGLVAHLRFNGSNEPVIVRSGQIHQDTVTSVRFDPDTDAMTSTSLDRSACILKTENDSLRVTRRLKGHSAVVQQCIGCKDLGSWITGASDSSYRRYELTPTFDSTPYLQTPFRTRAMSLSSTEDASMVLLGDGFGNSEFIRPKDSVVLATGLTDEAAVLTMSRDGNWLATADRQRNLRLYDNRIVPPRLVQEWRTEFDHSTLIRFAGNDRYLVASGLQMGIWEFREGQVRTPESPLWMTGLCTDLAWDGDFQRLCRTSMNGTALFERTDDGFVQMGTIENISGRSKVAMTRNGERIAVCFEDHSIGVFDTSKLAEPTRTATLIGHTMPITQLRFFGDDRFLASSSHDGTIRIFDTAADKPKAYLTLRNEDGSCYDFDIVNDASELIAIFRNRTLKRWSLEFDAISNELRTRVGRSWTDEEQETYLSLETQ